MFLQKWIIYQLYVDMTVENYGFDWLIGLFLPTKSFNLIDEKELKEFFNSTN